MVDEDKAGAEMKLGSRKMRILPSTFAPQIRVDL